MGRHAIDPKYITDPSMIQGLRIILLNSGMFIYLRRAHLLSSEAFYSQHLSNTSRLANKGTHN